MDTHTVETATAEAIAGAHDLDLAAQQKYGVEHRREPHNEAVHTLGL